MIPKIRSNVLTITATMVKELRERTGLGMMDCKKALVEADGDMELAIEDLRKKSVLKAAKKSGRITANGLLGLKTSEDLSRAAIVEINIETDFFDNSFSRLRFFPTLVWMLVHFPNNRSSVGKRDSGNIFRPAGFGNNKFGRPAAFGK